MASSSVRIDAGGVTGCSRAPGSDFSQQEIHLHAPEKQEVRAEPILLPAHLLLAPGQRQIFGGWQSPLCAACQPEPAALRSLGLIWRNLLAEFCGR